MSPCLNTSCTSPRGRYEGESAVERRDEAHIPEDLVFRTKPQIAAALIRTVAVLGVVTLDWIAADEAYGRDGEFLDEMDELEQRYVVEVPKNTTVGPWTRQNACRRPPGAVSRRSDRRGRPCSR